MITLNDYLYSGDTVLKILQRYTEDLRKDAKKNRNEIGYGKKVTFLKNIIGLWLLQESRREYARQGKNYSFAEIETMARQSHEPSSFIDPDDPVFVPHGIFPSGCRHFAGKPVSMCRKATEPFSAASMKVWH